MCTIYVEFIDSLWWWHPPYLNSCEFLGSCSLFGHRYSMAWAIGVLVMIIVDVLFNRLFLRWSQICHSVVGVMMDNGACVLFDRVSESGEVYSSLIHMLKFDGLKSICRVSQIGVLHGQWRKMCSLFSTTLWLGQRGDGTIFL